MKVETLKDVLQWTQQFHQALSARMQQSAENSENTRAAMLLDYLSTHEKQLASMIDDAVHKADAGTLNTWCLEFLDKNPIINEALSQQQTLADMSPDDIMAMLTKQHNQIIDLYRNLHERADIPAMKELLAQLVSLEEHHTMQVVQSANRLEDI